MNRELQLSRITSETFDIIIIGGGITGAGIALDAVSRGLTVALVEKTDFAYGTSSRSTKLIHGGLRYLKQLEFGLVREVGSERAILHRLAPNLVVPEKMLIPIQENRGLGYWLTSLGLGIYDFLAGVQGTDRRQMLTRRQTLAAEPLLKPEGVTGGARYAEYRTDDARLTLAIVRTAVHRGAVATNYTRATELLYNQGQVSGLRLRDELSGSDLEVHGRLVINAAGPWVDRVRESDPGEKSKSLVLSRGIHIVVAKQRLPIRQAIYFDAMDGRMIFAIPRGEITYIGTTDTIYTGDPDGVITPWDEADYLLQATNTLFPEVVLTRTDILSSWAGLRPLILEPGKSTSELSRKDEIFESTTGLISIAGGKLTGYRKMAERVVNLALQRLSRPQIPTPTRNIGFISCEFASWAEVKEYLEVVRSQITQRGGGPHEAEYLVMNYGRGTDTILEHVAAPWTLAKRLSSEAEFSIQHEMAMTLSDFFVRRSGILYFQPWIIDEVREPVISVFRKVFHWDAAREAREIGELDKWIREAKIQST